MRVLTDFAGAASTRPNDPPSVFRASRTRSYCYIRFTITKTIHASAFSTFSRDMVNFFTVPTLIELAARAEVAVKVVAPI